MEERQVTVDGKTYPLPEPFIVLATQNPVDYIGTFPLPEAQLDRFFLKVTLGYPSKRQEMLILSRFQYDNPLDSLLPVANKDDILNMQKATREVKVADAIRDYITSLVNMTREHPDLTLGASPRGSLFLMKASQAHALLDGRNYVIPDDVQKMVIPVLSHRLILKPEARLKEMTPERILKSIINTVYVPIGDYHYD